MVTPTEAPILCFLALTRHRHASVPESFEALWDANSTPVCWGCQEGIPIYCISVLASGMLPPPSPSSLFSTRRRWVEKSGGTSQPCHPGFAIVRVFPWPARSRSKICGPLTPASQLGPRSGVSDLKGKNFVCPARATSQRRDPWLRRHPQKFHGARFSAYHLRIPLDSRLFVRDVRVRAHPGTPGDR